ncbi:unnamed protein product [Ranitomeya imitator]|uniref:Uncharacterized protein n=1 Tax=Ranitomeya imitator TaxID=111125 RepID=A0ABN9M9G1_9NEOB|nr:unnamed protein product [Ranitomeya imitator]
MLVWYNWIKSIPVTDILPTPVQTSVKPVTDILPTPVQTSVKPVTDILPTPVQTSVKPGISFFYCFPVTDILPTPVQTSVKPVTDAVPTPVPTCVKPGNIRGLCTALQNAVHKPLMMVSLPHHRFWASQVPFKGTYSIEIASQPLVWYNWMSFMARRECGIEDPHSGNKAGVILAMNADECYAIKHRIALGPVFIYGAATIIIFFLVYFQLTDVLPTPVPTCVTPDIKQVTPQPPAPLPVNPQPCAPVPTVTQDKKGCKK